MKLSTDFQKVKHQTIDFLRSKNLILYLFFVTVATLFWFLYSLGKEYVANINVDVSYVNFPTDKEPVGITVRTHTLNVRAYGFALLRMKGNALFSNYRLDASKLKKSRLSSDKMLRYDLSISAVRNQFEGQLGDGISINSIFPEEVNFEVNTLKIKKIPIRPNLTMNLKSGYMLVDKPEIEPDSVTVRGAAELVDTLQAVYTEEIQEGEVSSSFEKKVALLQPHEKVELLPKYATLHYKIGGYIDEERVITIAPLNFPDTVQVVLYPEQVHLRYRTHDKTKKSIKDEDFVLVVDYNTSNDFSEKLEVQPISLPEGISNVQMTPRYVNYIMSSKK